MTCRNVGSGCNYPEGECLGFCLNKGYEVQYKNGTKLTDRESGAVFVVSGSNAEETQYQGASGRGTVKTSEVAALFEVDGAAEALSALDVQEGGDHYKKLGAYQPWDSVASLAYARRIPRLHEGHSNCLFGPGTRQGGHAGYPQSRPHAAGPCRTVGV